MKSKGEAAAWHDYEQGWRASALDDAGARRLFERAYAAFDRGGDSLGRLSASAAMVVLIASRHADFRDLGRCLSRLRAEAWPADATAVLCLRWHAAQLCVPALDEAVPFDSPPVHASAQAVYSALRSTLAVSADERLILGRALLDHYSLNNQRDAFEHAAALLQPALADPAANAYWVGAWWWRLATSYAKWGDHEAARTCRERARALVRDSPSASLADLDYAMTAEDLSECLRLQDLSAATALGARLNALGPQVNPVWRGHGLVAQARLHLMRNEPVAARTLCEQAWRIHIDAEVPPRERDVGRSVLANCHVLLQEETVALELFEACRASQSGGQLAVLDCMVLATRAAAALRQGQPDAPELLRGALRAASAMHWFALFFTLPTICARLFSAALEQGIETDYVCKAIRLRNLNPPDPAQQRWPWPLRIHALGGFALLRDDVALRLGAKAQKKPLELLKALVVAGGQANADALVVELWPDEEARDPRAAFEMTLSRLRKLIGVEGAIEMVQGRLAINRQLVWCDVPAFEALAARLVQTLRAPQPQARAVDALAEQVFALYAGPLFGDEPRSPWNAAARERLALAFQRAVAFHGGWLESCGHWREAIERYERGLAQQMLAEPLYRGLMRCHLALGERAEALLALRRCRDLLSQLLGVAPAEETERLARQIRP